MRGGDEDGAGLGRDGSAAELGAQPLEQFGGLEGFELFEGGLDQTVWFTEQTEQQMLGVELVVTESQQELLDAFQRGSGFIGESFERDQGKGLRAVSDLTTSL